MKFRFYIQDPFLGAITGTNDEAKARGYAASEDCFVVDTETGKWLSSIPTDVPDQEVQEAE